MSNLRERLATYIPRCLSEITANLEESYPEQSIFRFGLSNACEKAARVLGYNLQDYNAAYEGDLLFISPITLEWRDSLHRTLIFDSNMHGYHSEMNGSAKLRGSGEPIAFKCLHCAGKLFTLQVQLDYYDAIYDLWEDEPEIDIENYFCFFTLTGSCVACAQKAVITAMNL